MPPRRKACATCTLAKTKCVWEDETRCERCLRLNKVCADEMDERVLARKTGSRSAKRLKTRSAHEDEIAFPKKSASLTSSHPSPVEDVKSLLYAGAEKQELWLILFKNRMTQHFPFVVVPPHITAAELEVESPLLFNAIMMVACNEPNEQTARAVGLRQDIARETLIEGKRSIDVLQAILIASAFYHLHVHINHQITNLLAMGGAVLSDLRLNVSLQRSDRRKTMFATKDSPAFYDARKERTLEERRIFLGFCYITQFLFITFRRLECVKNTTYLDECCQVLEISRQYDTDAYLLYLARLTRQAQMMTLSLDIEDVSLTYRPSVHDVSFLDWLRNEFQAFHLTKLNNGHLKTPQALAHMKLVNLYLEEVASTFHEGQPAGQSNPIAIESSHRCHQVAKDLLHSATGLITGPPSHWTHIELWHSCHAMVVLLKTAAAIMQGGQNEDLQNSMINLLQKTEDVIVGASKDNESTIPADENNIFLRVAHQFRIVRERYVGQKALYASLEAQDRSLTAYELNAVTIAGADFRMCLEDLSDLEMQKTTWFYGLDQIVPEQ